MLFTDILMDCLQEMEQQWLFVCLISQGFSMIRISPQSSSAIQPFCSIHRDLDHLILAVDIIILQQSSGAAALILCCK